MHAIVTKQIEIIRNDWFGSSARGPHQIIRDVIFGDRSLNVQVRHILWSRPKDSCYQISYLLHRNYLIVTGDLGDAIYHWSAPLGGLTVKWIAGLDYSYFASKCLASEEGRGGLSWWADVAKDQLRKMLTDSARLVKQLDEHHISQDEMINAAYTRDEWRAFLHQHGYDLLGDDYGGYSDIGEEVSPRTLAHLIGIQMIYESIANAINTAPPGSATDSGTAGGGPAGEQPAQDRDGH